MSLLYTYAVSTNVILILPPKLPLNLAKVTPLNSYYIIDLAKVTMIGDFCDQQITGFSGKINQTLCVQNLSRN